MILVASVLLPRVSDLFETVPTDLSGDALLACGVTVVGSSDLTDAGLAVRRLLDVHYLVFDPSDLSTLAVAERALFELVAASYDDEIDRRKNLENIGVLLDVVGPGRILDFGTGTGLAIELANESVQLVGFDRSHAMLSLARARGLTTLNFDELTGMPPGSFDGVIASYVAHLSAALVDLPTIARSLRQGGIFAANFHKGLGLPEIHALAPKLGLVPVPMLGIRPDGHGAYGAWRRVRT
jgi:SAM-dependent methyltransferase